MRISCFCSRSRRALRALLSVSCTVTVCITIKLWIAGRCRLYDANIRKLMHFLRFLLPVHGGQRSRRVIAAKNRTESGLPVTRKDHMIAHREIEPKQVSSNHVGLAYHQGRAYSWVLYFCSSAAIAYSPARAPAIPSGRRLFDLPTSEVNSRSN